MVMYISTLLPILLCPCPAPHLPSPPPSSLPPPVPPQSSAWMQRSTLMTMLRIVTPVSMNCVTGPRRTTERWRQPRQGLTTLGWMGTLVALVRVTTRVVMCMHTHTHTHTHNTHTHYTTHTHTQNTHTHLTQHTHTPYTTHTHTHTHTHKPPPPPQGRRSVKGLQISVGLSTVSGVTQCFKQLTKSKGLLSFALFSMV